MDQELYIVGFLTGAKKEDSLVKLFLNWPKLFEILPTQPPSPPHFLTQPPSPPHLPTQPPSQIIQT